MSERHHTKDQEKGLEFERLFVTSRRMGHPVRRLMLVVVAMMMGAILPLYGQNSSTSVIPEAFPLKRYLTVWENSPFELEAPPPPPPEVIEEEQVSFAEEMALAGVLKIGKNVSLTVLDKSTGEYFRVTSQKNARGIRLVGMTKDPNPKMVRVKLALGEEVATIGYDQQLLAAAPKLPGASSVNRSSRPGMPPSRSNLRSPPTTNSQSRSPMPIRATQRGPSTTGISPSIFNRTIGGNRPQNAPLRGTHNVGESRPTPTTNERRRVAIPMARSRP